MGKPKKPNNKKRKLALKPKQQRQQKQKQKQKPKKLVKPKLKNPIHDEDPILFGSDPEPEPEPEPAPAPETRSDPSSPTRVHSLLEPYTKPQLISFLLDSAASDPDLRAKIRALADADTSHRKIFVHGLGWDTTKETLAQSFSPFGEIEDCNLIVDRNTGRAKGYGFVLFKTRSAAAKALREPQKRIGSRMTSCQLAAVGAVKTPESGRRIYVSNVPWDTNPEKLKGFFAKFGEIETGPIGFDMVTGKSKGYAIFVYRNVEDAKKVLEEPFKLFDGHNLHCKFASSGHGGEGQKMTAVVQPPQPVVPAVVATPQPILAAVAAAQNLALLGQNPAYAALLAQNPLFAAAALNPGLFNAAALGGGATGLGYGAVGGGGSVLGAYSGGPAAGVGFQGLQGYQGGPSSSSQGGQTSSGMGGGGFLPSFIW